MNNFIFLFVLLCFLPYWLFLLSISPRTRRVGVATKSNFSLVVNKEIWIWFSCAPCFFVQRCDTHHQHLPGPGPPPPGERDLSSYVSPEPEPGVRPGHWGSPAQHLHHPQPDAKPRSFAPRHASKFTHGSGAVHRADPRRLWLQEPVLWQLPGLQAGTLHSEGGDGENEGQAEREGLRKPDGRERHRPQPQPAGQGEEAGSGWSLGGQGSESQPHPGAPGWPSQVRLPFWAWRHEEEPELSGCGWRQHGHESPGASGIAWFVRASSSE